MDSTLTRASKVILASKWPNILLASLLLALAFAYVDFGKVGELVQTLPVSLLGVIFALQLPVIALAAARWVLTSSAFSLPVLYHDAFKVSWIGSYFGLFLPSSVGLEMLKTGYMMRKGCDLSSALKIVALDRFFGLVTLAALCLPSFVLLPQLYTENIAINLVFISCVVVILMALLVVAMISRRARQLIAAFVLLPRQAITHLFANVVGLKLLIQSVGIHLVVLFQMYLVLIAVGIKPNIYPMLIGGVLPILFLLRLPISINGIGVREGVFILFLGAFGVTSEQALVAAWIQFSIAILTGMSGGIVMACNKDVIYNTPDKLN
jgi:glycosyltransferase 2 family protein